MTRDPRPRLVADPAATRDPANPWHRLNDRLRALGRPELPLDASGTEVKDASFDLMSGGPIPVDVREAWDELRVSGRRLVWDFFAYDLDGETAADLAPGDLRLPPPPPWPEPDEVARVPVDFARAIPAPPSFPATERPGPFVGVARVAPGPIDLGPLAPRAVALLGGSDAR
jgi:hypothetical protein